MIKQALILCGGKGERLKPITKRIPKPLAQINKKPILGHQINYLKNQGINKFILATGYKAELIEEYISLNYSDLDIELSNSGDVDIMQRIINCKNYLNNEFLVCYGDTLANIDINMLFEFHSKHTGSGTVSSYQIQSQFGTLIIDRKGQVNSFLEKPLLDVWINIGVFILSKKLINKRPNTFVEFIEGLVREGDLFSYKHRGIHITVNTLSELEQAEKNIKNFK